jgi:hypothetical protein
MVSCTLLAHGSINNYRPTIDDVAFLIIITHGLRVIERQSAIDGHAMSASSMPRFPLFFASIICNGHSNEFGDYVVVNFFQWIFQYICRFCVQPCDFKDFFC